MTAHALRAPVPRARVGAAALSAAVGIVHLGLAPAHLTEWWAHGVLFVLAGALQLALAGALVRRPGTPVALAGVALTLGVVLAYVVSRTNGLPGGPHAWQPEDAGLGDLSTTASELVLVVMLIGLLGPVAARRTFTALACVGAGLWLARATNVLL